MLHCTLPLEERSFKRALCVPRKVRVPVKVCVSPALKLRVSETDAILVKFLNVVDPESVWLTPFITTVLDAKVNVPAAFLIQLPESVMVFASGWKVPRTVMPLPAETFPPGLNVSDCQRNSDLPLMVATLVDAVERYTAVMSVSPLLSPVFKWALVSGKLPESARAISMLR